jgi:cell division protein FtsZ
MGTGLADGPNRAMNAVRQALESPLLDSSSIRGTKDILLNIISGTEEVTMGEIGEIIDYLQDEAGQDATIIWGNGNDPKLGDQISVTIIATGFDVNPNRLFQAPVETVELMSEDSGFEINLEDEIPFEVAEPVIPKAEPIRAMQTEPVAQKKKWKKEKKHLVKDSNPDNTNVDGWFFRQFNRFFDDKDSSDTPVSEENNN